jgi:hypothetical protein
MVVLFVQQKRVVDGEKPLKAFQRRKSKNLKRKLNPEKGNAFVRRGRKATGFLIKVSSTSYLSAR